MALGFGGLQFGSDIDVAGALQGISQAIGNSASIYQQATTQVSDLAKQIADMNINYLQQTAQQSQNVLAPFQQAGASGITALQNLLGVNGTAAQQQAASSIIGASTGAVQQANINALNAIFGGGFGNNIPQPQTPAAQAPTQPQQGQLTQQWNAAQQALGQAQQAAQANPNDPQAQQALQVASQNWQQLQQPGNMAAMAAESQQYGQAQAQYQQQLAQYQQQQAQQQSGVQPTTGPYSQTPFSNLLNTSPEQYAQNLTQTGINLAQSATDAFTNNTIVQQSLAAMNKLGQQATQNSAAARGMLNSGNTMAELYNQGQAIAGQYLLPQITSLSNNIMGNVNSAGNAQLQGQQQLANTTIGNMMGANTAVANNAMNSQISGLSGLLGSGLSAAQTQAGVLGNLGSSVAQQNTNMANTQSNAILSNAQQQSNALMSNAQLQLSAAQANLRPDVDGIGGGLLSALGGSALGTGLMAAMMI